LRAYIDTSVLTSVYCDEPNSRKAERILQKYTPVISGLTRLELSSAVAKKVRAKTLTKNQAAAIISMFHEHIRSGVFEVQRIDEDHYDLACDWLDLLTTSMRSLDSLHLAVAHSLQIPLITADIALARSARKLNIPVETL
jgi:predicted nucleic acid-binding protein